MTDAFVSNYDLLGSTFNWLKKTSCTFSFTGSNTSVI